jgi:hypothetical protein
LQITPEVKIFKEIFKESFQGESKKRFRIVVLPAIGAICLRREQLKRASESGGSAERVLSS